MLGLETDAIAGKVARIRCKDHLDVYLLAAQVEERETTGVRRNFVPAALLESATVFGSVVGSSAGIGIGIGIGNRAPASTDIALQGKEVKSNGSSWRKGGGWGCCLDCMIERTAAGWEISAGAVYLLREFALSTPHEAIAFLPSLFVLLEVKRIKGADKLHELVLEQVCFLP